MGECAVLALPGDVVANVMKMATYDGAIALSSTCRQLRRLADSEDVWMFFCRQRWGSVIDLGEWRRKASSSRQLLRLLRALDPMVGAWSSEELAPRGGLLLVTWASFSLLGLRVIPRGDAGGVRFITLFEVLGNSDGTFKLELVSYGSPNLRLPAAFSWSSSQTKEFHLDISCTKNIEDEPYEDSDEDDNLQDRKLLLFQNNLLRRAFLLAPDSQYPSLCMSSNFGEQESIGWFVREYFLHRFSPSTGGALVCRYSYQKLSVQVPCPGRELAGLWTGLYGIHGLEIVSVAYDGDRITATKVVGDPNVPCNKVSFYGDIFSRSQEASPTLLDHLAHLAHLSPEGDASVKSVYKGMGRVARHDFRDPRWIEGQLFVSNAGRMGFLWEDEHFAVQFSRLDLNGLALNGLNSLVALNTQ